MTKMLGVQEDELIGRIPVSSPETVARFMPKAAYIKFQWCR